MNILDYIYSKSKLKKKHESIIRDNRKELAKRGKAMNDAVLRINELKLKNYRLQMFIEKNVPEEEKNKFFNQV